MTKLDLEQYDLRSSDFDKIKSIRRPNRPYLAQIPKLDIQKVVEWKQEVNVSSSSEGEDDEDEEEDLLSENIKYLPIGSALNSNMSMSRKQSLFRRKEEVIDALNDAYDNEESKNNNASESISVTSHSFNVKTNDDEVNMKSVGTSDRIVEKAKGKGKKGIPLNLADRINSFKP